MKGGLYLASDRGFISIYFLMMFMIISTLSLYYLNKINTNQYVIENIKKSNRMIDLEAIIIHEINCQLQYSSILDSFYVQDIEVTLEQENDRIYAVVYDKIPFELELIIDVDRNQIYNYEVMMSSF